MDFSEQHIVITGGSTGIGHATAKKIISHGGRVTLLARTAETLEKAASEIGDGAKWVATDVGDQDQLTTALDQAVADSGPIDGLFLNAGTEGMYGPVTAYDDAAFERVMTVNAFSPFWAIRHVIPSMIERGKGAILITGSLASERGMVGNPGYLVSKHAALGLARAIAMEAAPNGIRSNCLCPGFIETPMLNDTPPEARNAMADRVPLGHIGTAEEAANVAAFLLSDDASHVTAQSWAVDGGLLGTMPI